MCILVSPKTFYINQPGQTLKTMNEKILKKIIKRWIKGNKKNVITWQSMYRMLKPSTTKFVMLKQTIFVYNIFSYKNLNTSKFLSDYWEGVPALTSKDDLSIAHRW